MKKVLFLATLLVSVFCFSACSDDDGGFELGQVEGTWGLTAVSGYFYDEGEKIPYNETYNPFEPQEDDQKIVITKQEDNKYQMASHIYSNGSWRNFDIENFSVDGKKIIPEDMSGVDYTDTKFLELTSDKMVIEAKGSDEDGEFYQKLTYKRMAE